MPKRGEGADVRVGALVGVELGLVTVVGEIPQQYLSTDDPSWQTFMPMAASAQTLS